MRKQHTITIGLAFPNSILFGFTFVLLGVYVFSQLPIEQTYNSKYGNTSVFIFGMVFLILGLLSLTTFRKIKIDKMSNEIYYFNSFFFFINVGQKYKLNEFDKIVVGTRIRNYASGDGFLITAKSYYSIKESDIWIVKTGTRKRIEIRNLGSKRKTNRIVDKIVSFTDLKL